MMMKKSKKGFTLVELLVTVSILVFVMAAAGGALAISMQNMAFINEVTEDQANARQALLTIARDARQATHIYTDASGQILYMNLTDAAGDRRNIRYVLNQGRVERGVTLEGGAVAATEFIGARLNRFRAEISDQRSDPDHPKNELLITIEGVNIDLSTRVSLSRLPGTDKSLAP